MTSLGDLPACLTITLKVEQYTKAEGVMMMGIFWPVDVFVRHEGKQPEHSQLVYYKHNTKELQGT